MWYIGHDSGNHTNGKEATTRFDKVPILLCYFLL